MCIWLGCRFGICLSYAINLNGSERLYKIKFKFKFKQQKLIGHHKSHVTPAPIGNIVYEIDDDDNQNNYASNIDYDEQPKYSRFDGESSTGNADDNNVADDNPNDEVEYNSQRRVFETIIDKSDKDAGDVDDSDGSKEDAEDTAVATADNGNDGNENGETISNSSGNNKNDDNVDDNNENGNNNDIAHDRAAQTNEKQERQRYPVVYSSATGNLKQRPTEMTHKNWGKWKIEISFASLLLAGEWIYIQEQSEENKQVADEMTVVVGQGKFLFLFQGLEWIMRLEECTHAKDVP